MASEAYEARMPASFASKLLPALEGGVSGEVAPEKDEFCSPGFEKR